MNPETHKLPPISLLGIPFDANSSFLRGTALAPPLIRAALHSTASNLWSEEGIDFGEDGLLADAGDLTISPDPKAAFPDIERSVRTHVESGNPLICLGGDHSITYPIVKAVHERFPDLQILHFDAHSDLYHELDGNPLSHGCPFARIMESGLARRLMQVGIRTLNGHQFEQAQRFGVEIITMRNLEKVHDMRLKGPLYISLDLDVLDPAFAPGVSHFEPGGMSVREVITFLQAVRVPIVGADIVEYNPTRDVQGRTAVVAAKLLKEIAAAILRAGRKQTEWP